MQRRGPAQALPADLDSSSSRPVVVVIVGLTAVLGRDVMSDGGSGPCTIPEMTAEVVRHAGERRGGNHLLLELARVVVYLRANNFVVGGARFSALA